MGSIGSLVLVIETTDNILILKVVIVWKIMQVKNSSLLKTETLKLLLFLKKTTISERMQFILKKMLNQFSIAM